MQRAGQPETTIASAGVRLAVREWPGAGPSLVLLHGLASSSHVFDLVAPRLAGAFRVVAYDQRGHGASGKPDRGYGFGHLSDDAVAVIRGLRLGRPVVLGHSWGASVAIELATRHPRRVSGAILLDGGFMTMRHRMDWTTARTTLAPPELKGLRVQEFRAMLGEHLDARLPLTPEMEAVFLSYMRVDREGRIHPRLSRRNHLRILRAMWEQDTLALLRRVRPPTLVLAARTRDPAPGEEGFVEAKRAAASAVRAIGRPVRFEWIEGIHDVPLQRPDAVARRIARFAREIVS